MEEKNITSRRGDFQPLITDDQEKATAATMVKFTF